MTNDGGHAPRNTSGDIGERVGYMGGSDPGQPTGLMQPQTVPVNQGPAQPQQQPAGGSAAPQHSSSDS